MSFLFCFFCVLLIAHRALWPDANVFFPYGYANSVALLTISMMSTEKSKKLVLGRLRKKNRERNFLISIINKRVSRWFNQRLSRTMVLLQLEVMFIRNKKKKTTTTVIKITQYKHIISLTQRNKQNHQFLRLALKKISQLFLFKEYLFWCGHWNKWEKKLANRKKCCAVYLNQRQFVLQFWAI